MGDKKIVIVPRVRVHLVLSLPATWSVKGIGLTVISPAGPENLRGYTTLRRFSDQRIQSVQRNRLGQPLLEVFS